MSLTRCPSDIHRAMCNLYSNRSSQEEMHSLFNVALDRASRRDLVPMRWAYLSL